MLKVGDIVQILHTANDSKYSIDGPSWDSEMNSYIGSTCTVKEICGNPNWVVLKENGWTWMKEDLRLLNHQERLNRKYIK